MRRAFRDLIRVGEKPSDRGAVRPRITCDTDPREPEILGRREGETEPMRRANCDGAIIRLLRVP